MHTALQYKVDVLRFLLAFNYGLWNNLFHPIWVLVGVLTITWIKLKLSAIEYFPLEFRATILENIIECDCEVLENGVQNIPLQPWFQLFKEWIVVAKWFVVYDACIEFELLRVEVPDSAEDGFG